MGLELKAQAGAPSLNPEGLPEFRCRKPRSEPYRKLIDRSGAFPQEGILLHGLKTQQAPLRGRLKPFRNPEEKSLPHHLLKKDRRSFPLKDQAGGDDPSAVKKFRIEEGVGPGKPRGRRAESDLRAGDHLGIFRKAGEIERDSAFYPCGYHQEEACRKEA